MHNYTNGECLLDTPLLAQQAISQTALTTESSPTPTTPALIGCESAFRHSPASFFYTDGEAGDEGEETYVLVYDRL